MSRPRRSGWLRPDFPAPTARREPDTHSMRRISVWGTSSWRTRRWPPGPSPAMRCRPDIANSIKMSTFQWISPSTHTPVRPRGCGGVTAIADRYPGARGIRQTTQGTRACRRGSRSRIPAGDATAAAARPRRTAPARHPDPGCRRVGTGSPGGSIWAGSTGTWVLNTTANSTGPAPRTTRTTSSGWNSWHPAAGRSCGSAPGSFGISSLRSWLESGAL